MTTDLERCELHELAGCSICSGQDRKYLDSLREPQRDPNAPLPKLPGGPTIQAHYPGRCVGCGRQYQKGAVIHYDTWQDGWVLVDCCA